VDWRLLKDDTLVDEKADLVGDWLKGGILPDDDPGELAAARTVVQSETRGFRTVRYRGRSATSRLIESLLLRGDPVDFVTAERIDGLLLVEPARVARRRRDPEQIELHHVFPKAFLEKEGVPDEEQDLIANLAPQSGATNGWIADRPPYEYVKQLIDEFDRKRVDAMMNSHFLDTGLLLRPDGFKLQIESRTTRLQNALDRLLDPRELDVLGRGRVTAQSAEDGPRGRSRH
jgi:hypothetical protein